MFPRFVLALTVTLAGCSESHPTVTDTGSAPPDTGAVPDAGVTRDVGAVPDAGPPDAPAPGTLLATCFAGGGDLVEVATVNNNDSADHGALLGLAVTDDGLLAVAGADGTLKLWTLSAELVGTFDGSILTYGPEIPSAPITDLAVDGADVIVGDVRGLVLRMSQADGLFPVGGTTPEIAIRAVAWDDARSRLAHAQSGDVLPLTLRSDTETLELATEIDVHDVLFEADGSLLVAGSRDGFAVIERRSPSAPDAPTDALVTELEGPFLEIATSRAGIVGVTASAVSLPPFALPRTGLRSVAVAEDETSAFALVAGETGVEVLAVDGGHGSVGLPLAGAVTVRVDATGTLAIVGTEDARVHVLACR
jgi:hypothetical protein